jgi:hypothetical protein
LGVLQSTAKVTLWFESKKKFTINNALTLQGRVNQFILTQPQ